MVPIVLRCFHCGKENPPLKCGKCGVALYCEKKCQKGNWSYHKKICSVDAASPEVLRDSVFERDSLIFNDSCRHGGPDPDASCSSSFIKVAQVLALLQAETDMHEHLNLMHNFARSHDPDILVARVCASMAMDAFADNNGGLSRLLMRLACFVECYVEERRAYREAFRTGGNPPSLKKLEVFLETTMSRAGLVAELRSRATCSCLLPKATAKK